METRLPEREQDPACLKEGTMVGPWRVLEPRGHGVNGTVYRVEREGNEKAGSFALKLAHRSMDERFEREAELLSLMLHPNVPRFHSRGYYECSLGLFPYVVTELVEGVSLYDWARHRNPTQRQVVEVLAQVARALDALHRAGGVHRDVKGDSVVVRLAEGRPFLADLGTGMVEGWRVLTGDVLPPGTAAYRAPEAWSFGRMYVFFPDVHYEAGSADDLFALGVTAYRLVTGEYPPSTHPLDEGSEVWKRNGRGPRPPRELNPRVSAELDAVILRLMALRRSQRFDGSAAEAAKALEQVLRDEVPGLDKPLFDFQERDAAARAQQERQQAEEQRLEAEHMEKERATLLARGTLLGTVLLGLVVLWVLLPRQESPPRWQTPSTAEISSSKQLEGADAGTIGLGEGISAAVVTKEGLPHQAGGFAIEVPKTPLDGQRRAPCRPQIEEVEINGGCWRYALRVKPPCDDGYYEWEKSCYTPVLRFQRGPTSDDP